MPKPMTASARSRLIWPRLIWLCLVWPCLAVAPARADCPDWLVADMVARSVPAYEIGRMCGPSHSRSLTPRSLAPRSADPSIRPAPGMAPPAMAPPALVPITPAPPAAAPSAMAPAAPSRGSTRCVTSSGRSCVTRSRHMSGSPCWCDLADGYEEGTIR